MVVSRSTWVSRALLLLLPLLLLLLLL